MHIIICLKINPCTEITSRKGKGEHDYIQASILDNKHNGSIEVQNNCYQLVLSIYKRLHHITKEVLPF
jgi:hypothetical protein